MNRADELERTFESRTLRNHAEAVLGEMHLRAVKLAASETDLAIDTFPAKCPYTLDQLLATDDILANLA